MKLRVLRGMKLLHWEIIIANIAIISVDDKRYDYRVNEKCMNEIRSCIQWRLKNIIRYALAM